MGWQPAGEKTTFRLRISICVAFVSNCAALNGADRPSRAGAGASSARAGGPDRLFGGTGCGDIEGDDGDDVLLTWRKERMAA